MNDHLPNASASTPHGITLAKITLYFNNNGLFDRMLLDRTGLDGYYSINMFIPSDSVAETN